MELTIEPTLKQHECYLALNDTSVDEVFFGGGAGGGKSWLICESRLVNSIRFPGYKSFIGRAELKRLMQSTFVTWGKVCSFYGVPRDTWRLDGKYNYIEFINPRTREFDDTGSRIDLLDLKFLPAEDPLYERYGSLEYSDGAIEEAGEVHPLAHEVLKGRLNRHMNDEYGINPCLLCTGNPKKNWTYQTFYKPWREGRLPENMVFIQSLYSDNPFTAKTYGQTLSNIKDKVTRQRLKDGNWEYENDPNVLMDFDAISDLFTNHVDGEDEDDEFGSESPVDKYMTVDVARFGGDKIVIICWRGWCAYKVLYREKQSIETTNNWIKEVMQQERIPRSHVVIDEDGVGGGVVDGIKGVKGFMANHSPYEGVFEEEEYEEDQSSEDEDDVEKAPKIAYANLKTQCGYFLAKKVNDRDCSIITEDEEVKAWIIEELEQIKEANTDKDDQKKRLVAKVDVKAVIGRSPDFGDAILMRSYFDVRTITPHLAVAVQTRPKWISRAKRR